MRRTALVLLPVLLLALAVWAIPRQTSSGTWLYITDKQGLIVYDTDTRATVQQLPLEKGDWVGEDSPIALSPDGTLLYLDRHMGTRTNPGLHIQMIDTTTWQTIGEYTAPTTSTRVTDVHLSDDGRWLLVRNSGDILRPHILDARTLMPQARVSPELADCLSYAGLAGAPGHDLLYAACGQELMAVEADSLQVVWRKKLSSSIERAEAYASWNTAERTPFHPLGHNTGLLRLKLSPDGRRLYGALPCGIERVTLEHMMGCTDLFAWDAQTGSLLQERQISSPSSKLEHLSRMQLSPDGQTIYIGWARALWEIATNTLGVRHRHELNPLMSDGTSRDNPYFFYSELAPDQHGREVYINITTRSSEPPD